MTLSRTMTGFLAIALVYGLLFRLYPIVLGQPALSEAFITEDGYLMLTVARNMALGLGMSVSDGTIPTNGVQPMATVLFSIPYLLTGGDKVSSLVGIHLILAAIAVGGVFAIRTLAARLLRDQAPGALLPWAAAALWFLGPVLLRHSMNGLETGLITLATVVTLLHFSRVIEKGQEATLADRLGLGMLCGLAFLARIDAAILSVMIFGVWALDLLFRQRAGLGKTVAWLFPAGLASLIVAAPWLLNNLLGFGSVMPISGSAQSLTAQFGSNAALVPTKIFEHMFPMLPIPGAFERNPLVMAVTGGTLVVVLAIFLSRMMRFASPSTRAVVAAYALHGAALATYYGLFFGAGHFFSRYLAPIAPLLIIAMISVTLEIGRRIARHRPRILALAYGAGGAALSCALLILLLLPGAPEQGHSQVIAWVEENVPDDTWVGAVQTGTLGYWHDRTINLDGKVNPAALEARRRLGHVLVYVTESEIDYIADWAGVGDWATRPEGGFSEAFELVLQDQQENLAILRRREASP